MLRVVLVTAPSAPVARKIAESLVRKHLAACVNVVASAKSYYLWKNRFCADSEKLLIIKTAASRIPALIREIQRLHPAEIPEIISLPILEGASTYLEWVRKMTEKQDL